MRVVAGGGMNVHMLGRVALLWLLIHAQLLVEFVLLLIGLPMPMMVLLLVMLMLVLVMFVLAMVGVLMLLVVLIVVVFQLHVPVLVVLPIFAAEVGAAVAMVGVRTSLVPAVFVAVQHPHDVAVAQQSEDRRAQHDQGLFYYFLVEDAVSGRHEELDGDHPDDGHVDEGAQRLHLLVAEGEVAGTDLVALVNCIQRDSVCRHVREQVEGVGEDGNRVRVVPSQKLQRHEDERDDGYFAELGNDDTVLLVHYINYNSNISTEHHSRESRWINIIIFLEPRLPSWGQIKQL